MGAVLAGHYYILKPLGRGGFGQTFLARDSHLPGKPLCVVKQLKPGLSSPGSLQVAKRLFDLEAEVLYCLGNHDQIPRLLAHFEQEGEFYLVQEFVEGWSLDREFKLHKQLDEANVIQLLNDTLHVLAFVHTQHVIHRDIKPSNLMRRQRDHKIILIDFGAVKQVSAQRIDSSGQTSFTVAVGSPGYMPVEQRSSLPQFSSDIYAVGMVGLQALSGIPPKDFPKDEQGEICCEQLYPLVLPELAAILNRMVRYDYRERYQNATEALQALQPLVERSALIGEPKRLQVVLPFVPEELPQLAELEVQDQTRPPQDESTLVNSLPQATTLPQSSHSLSTGTAATAPTLPSQVDAPQFSRQEYRNRRALINKVRNYWVKGVLETSLHDQVVLELGLEDRPDAVASPWTIALETSQQTAKTLPHGTQIIAILDQLGVGRSLLILGDPGAGKTTTLLQLARDLVMRADQDIAALIPVVLNLSSWSGEKPSIADWVVEELNAKYQIPRKISRPWIEQQNLLLLLDGLDEIRAEDRDACVSALNGFQQQFGAEMVVCCRIADYEALSQRLSFQSAIYLRSLTPAQIQHYLNSLSADLTGLRTLLAEDAALQELARSPLMLNIMVLAYQGVAAQDLLKTSIVEERRRQLLNAYIERMFRRRRTEQPYSEMQAIAWLSWLAQRMIEQSQTVFLIEQLQPTWLPSQRQRLTYRLGMVVMGVLMGAPFGIITGGLTNGIINGWVSGLIKGAINALVFGLIFGLIFGLNKSEIETVETLKWSWKEAWKSLLIGLKNGLPLGLTAGLLFGLISAHIPGITPEQVARVLGNGWRLGVMSGAMAGVSGAVVYALAGGLRGSTIETKTSPNQGIRRTILSALISGLIGGLAIATLMIAIYGMVFGWQYGIMYGLSYGFFGGLIVGFIFGGGQACLKHLVLRLILYRNRSTPWNYSRFLNDVAERIFLQKVGGGYIFIHRLLLEHFARLGTDLGKANPAKADRARR